MIEMYYFIVCLLVIALLTGEVIISYSPPTSMNRLV